MCLPSRVGLPVEQAGLEIEALEVPGGRIEGLRLRTELVRDGLSLHLEVRSITFRRGWALSRLRVECPVLEVNLRGARCRMGRLVIEGGTFGTLHYRFSLDHDRAAQRVRIVLDRKQGPIGQVVARYVVKQRAGSVELRDVSLDALPGMLARMGIALPMQEISGRAGLGLRFRGDGEDWRWKVTGEVDSLGLSNASGTLAAEDVELLWRARGVLSEGGAEGRISVDWRAGGGYLDPLYLEVAPDQAPIHLEADFRRDRTLVLRNVRYRHPGVLTLEVKRLQWPDGAGGRLDIGIPMLDLARAWPVYGQPWLAGTLADDLVLEGRLSGDLRIDKGRPSRIHLSLEKGRIDDRHGRIRLTGLEARIDTARDGALHRSLVRWSGGRLYRVALGAAELPLESRGDRWRLAAEARIPIIDGALLIDRFDLEPSGSGDPLPRWGIDAVLTPLSLRRLSEALGWPPFSGTLSGMIPDMRYENHRLQVGGILLARVFDGAVRVRNLVLERPFGRFPILEADIDIDHLDLEQLTSAFSFGRIEGRLSGYIRDLVLENWQPVAFDAWLGTPDDYRGPRRISQRAVENLSSIGGGAAGALSKGFLRFFENFPYERLGIGCRLENGVCRMRGVAPAPQGYYIVKGRWLPRLDVVGYATRVDWKTLVARLEAATRGGEAQIR